MLVAILLCAAAAWGQRREGDPELSVTFGFESAVVAGRWMPITVVIEGGAEPFDGRVVVRYQQDRNQAATIERRIAATPGRQTPVHMVIRPGAQADEVSVTLHASNGRVVQRRVYAQLPGRRELPLPFWPGQADLIIPGIAARDADLSSMRWIADEQKGKSAVALPIVRRPILQPSQLPMSWAAYDGVLAVVVDGDCARQADPRSLAALRDWVAGGGRLIIIAADPGGDGVGQGGWRDWLPPGPHADVVSIGPVAEMFLPREVLDVVTAGAPDAISAASTGPSPGPTREKDEGKPEGETPPQSAGTEQPAAAPPRRAGRAMQLTEAGRRAGWQQRWLLDHRTDGASLLAEGPVGFGWVVILGMDPRTATPQVSGDDMIAVWADALRVCLDDFLEVASQFGGGGMNLPSGMTGFAAPLQTAAMAHNSALSATADVPTAGGGAIVFVLVAGLVLVLLVGPVDAIALRRLRLRHRSWMTALAWIALAATAAHFLPRLVRSGQTIVTRVTCVDILSPGSANEAFGLAFATGLTGVFSGRTQDAQIVDGRGEALWSGTSTVQSGWYEQPVGAHFVIPCVQSGPAITTASPADPWGGLLPGDGVDNEPRPMRLNLWTFRTFTDQARTRAPVQAIVKNIAGDWEVEIGGLPADAQTSEAWLRLRDGWRRIRPNTAGEAWSVRSNEHVRAAPDAWRAGALWHTEGQHSYWYGQSEIFAPRHAFSLAGAERRELAIDAMVQSGRWAVVYLHVMHRQPAIDEPPATTSDAGVWLANAETRQIVIYRVVTPLPEHAWLNEESESR